MGSRKSVLARFCGRIINLAVLGALGWGAWAVYSHKYPDSADSFRSSQSTGFNCRRALTHLAADYKCRDSASCTLSPDQLVDLRQREIDIGQNCN
jgi:hypothetical protein